MASRISRIRPNKTWLILGTALGVGLLAALVARNYLSNQMEAIEAKSRGKSVNVVVAKHELRRGEKLTTENVAVRPVPADFAHSNALLPGDFERVEGQTLAFPAKSGEMIMWSMMEGRRVPTFSARVEAGRRAITVAVDEINSISGLIEPGDVIDLMATLDRKGRKITVPLLQSVQVMATGQRSVDDPKSGERRQYSTVTLDTTPDQARNVIVAREAGKLTALLRNPQDKQAVGSSVDIAALLRAPGDDVGPVADRQVPVLYGGRSGKLPPEGLRLGQYVMNQPGAPGDASANPAPAVGGVGLNTTPPAGQVRIINSPVVALPPESRQSDRP